MDVKNELLRAIIRGLKRLLERCLGNEPPKPPPPPDEEKFT